jgi:hypothetical protein
MGAKTVKVTPLVNEPGLMSLEFSTKLVWWLALWGFPRTIRGKSTKPHKGDSRLLQHLVFYLKPGQPIGRAVDSITLVDKHTVRIRYSTVRISHTDLMYMLDDVFYARDVHGLVILRLVA